MSTKATANRRKAQTPSEPQTPVGGNDSKKKRPTCARCTELGLIGQCVYEIDEFNRHLSIQDQHSELNNRVGQLEAEIEGLNEHGSQWLSEPSSSVRYGGDVNTLIAPPPSFPSSATTTLRDSISTFSMSLSSHTGIKADTGATSIGLSSILPQSPDFIDYEASTDMHQQFSSVEAINSRHHNMMQPCDCVRDASNYQTMLELSLRLRKAAGILGQYPAHQAGSYCLLHQTLLELDALTTDTLSSVDSPHRPVSSYHQTPTLPPPFNSASPHIFTPSASRASGAAYMNNAGSGSLMSWDPRTRPY
ncbi:hypothetical protein BT96DRAFT_986640 [Gymnopus androsaceus JB14]|uniref:Uncharacterized protein n=1 Tax=Gymnopus androsaceus JB14 TaxID=1447944 RepID=A0A6A4IC31_9AGAR|nr:hypothetical protein BT96DRAFT_986640 [Gymnopus androsaceus JB14]